MQYLFKLVILAMVYLSSVACQQATTVYVSINNKEDLSAREKYELNRFSEIIDPNNTVTIKQKENVVIIEFSGVLAKESHTLIKKSLERLLKLEKPLDDIGFTLTITEEKLPVFFSEEYGERRSFVLKPKDSGRGFVGLRSYDSGNGNSKLYCLYETALQESSPHLFYRKVIQARQQQEVDQKIMGTMQQLINLYNSASPGKALNHKVTPLDSAYDDLIPLVRLINKDTLILSFIEESESVVGDPAEPPEQPKVGLKTALEFPNGAKDTVGSCNEQLLNSSNSFYQAFLFPSLAGKVTAYNIENEYIW